MGNRSDKMHALKRYLVGTTGIPSISLENMGITGPFPYRFTVTTSRKLQNWHDNINGNCEPKRLNIHIRYDRSLDSVADAWVGMRLEEFVQLLQSHEETLKERRH